MLTYLLTNALVLGVFGAFLIALLYCAFRQPVEFVGVVLVAWIATVALRDSVSLAVVVSDFRISAMDLLALIMAAVAFTRFLLYGVRGAAGALTLALLLFLVIHVVRGIPDFGLQTAINSGRTTFYFIAALAYAATVPAGWNRSVWKVVIVAGTALAVLAVPFWLTGGLGSADTSIIRNGELIATRPIVAAGALLILQAGILSLALRWPSRQSSWYLASASAAVVLLLQHRTVWVAGLAVVIVGFFYWAASAGRSADRTVLATIGIGLIVLPGVLVGLSRSEPLVRSVQEVRHGDSTFSWRTTGWQELISSHDSVDDLVAGVPSGSSLERRVNGGVVDVSAHNGFVEAYVRFGLPGVFALTLLGGLLWIRRKGVAEGSGLSTAAVGLLLLTQLVYSLGFGFEVVQGIIAGILVSGLTIAVKGESIQRAPLPSSGPMRLRHS
jgi:hypothetical protein